MGAVFTRSSRKPGVNPFIAAGRVEILGGSEEGGINTDFRYLFWEKQCVLEEKFRARKWS